MQNRTTTAACIAMSLAGFLLGLEAQANPFGPSLKLNRVVPPPVELSGIKSIEVGSFSGQHGSAVAAGVKEALLNSSRGHYNSKHPTLNEGFVVNYFEVVTLGGDGKVAGSVDIAEEVEEYKAKQQKKDSNGNVIKDSEGKAVMIEVDCKKRTVTASVRWSLADTGGRVITQQSFDEKSSDSKCGDDRKNLDSTEKLAGQALAAAPVSVANGFAPRWDVHTIDLSRDKTTKEALNLAKDDNWTLAVCALQEIVASDPYNVDALYNQGALVEASGWYDAASELYTKAVSVTADKKASEGLSRVSTRKAQLAALATMGQAWKETAPDYGSCPAIPDGRPVVLKKDAQLHSAPEAGSASLANVPKGMKLYILDETGPMFKVQTGDGAVGWVDPKTVK